MLRKLAFEDMKQNALEQKALFCEKFDGFFKSVEKVRELQSMILGEFKSFQSVAFFIAAVCTCYFFTSTPRTAAARLPLFIGLFVVMFIERLVTSWGVTDTQSTATVSYQSRPQRSHSSWSAPRIATSGRVQHRKSAIHIPSRHSVHARVKSEKFNWFWSQSIVFTKPFKIVFCL